MIEDFDERFGDLFGAVIKGSGATYPKKDVRAFSGGHHVGHCAYLYTHCVVFLA
jgi:hypothetical protein